MTSWEELFVDREIDGAWRSFRREVTDAIEALDYLATLEFRSEYVDENPVAGVTRDVDALRVVLRCTLQHPTLRGFGFRSDRRGNLTLMLGRDEIDRATAAIILGLREGATPVVHPSFLEWGYDADPPRRYRRPGLIPVSEQRRGIRFDVVAPLSPEQLQVDVLDALAERVHGPFGADDDGGFTITGSDGELCFVNVRDEGAIEVWTVLAVDVEHPASIDGFYRMLPRLLEEAPRHRFYLDDGTVYASRAVDGFPFVPSHLYTAVEATLELFREHRPMSDFLAELAHPDRGCQAEAQQQELPF